MLQLIDNDGKKRMFRMSFDGLFTRAMVSELSSQLKGGRINKIHQPFQNEVVLNIRANGKNSKLLLSVHPSYARVQLTNEIYENPSEAPMFCMVLRKHLEGSVIENIYQAGLDRIIIFEVKGRNEIGDLSYKQLIVEIMGRHSNIILIDKEKNMILDSIKHVSSAVNSYRVVLPGHEYVMPPQQNKLNPLEADEQDVLKRIDFNGGKIDSQIVAHFAGISPLLAKEIVFQAKMANRITIPETFSKIMNRIKNEDYEPTIIFGEKKESFYLFPLEHLKGERKTFSSLSELLDRFYFGKAERDRVKQQANDLLRFIIQEKEKNERKIVKLQDTLNEAKNKDQFQLFGELITANMHAMKRGMEKIEVVNYYDENEATVSIPLDPLKTPSQNAQNYFHKYQKAKNALIVVEEQLEKTKEELKYFEQLLQQVETASPGDIEEIHEELVEGGYLKAKKKGGKKKNEKPSLEKYRSSDGIDIYVGKNNKQNDYLTNKFARRDDLWLHTKNIPGSHVVIRSDEPSEQSIREAAMLAAYFSKGRNSSSVPVDFTKIRYVKKPSGAKPGFVIYEKQQTIYVTPDEEMVIQLKNNGNS